MSQASKKLTSVLFESPLTIRIRCADREDYLTQLRVKMTLQPTSQSSQMLQVELTDPEDPFFIYTMDCTEQDYHVLKNEQ